MANLELGLSDLTLGADTERSLPKITPPKTTSGGIVTFDITSKFRDATKTLVPGELVKDGFFTLFESVGALEIMDPKMDSGCLAPGETLDETYNVAQALLPEEVVGIMDQLLCHEMAWHLGYPLAQTLFTSVYMESILMPQPDTLEEAHFIRNSNSNSNSTRTPASPMHDILRAFCLGLLKTCGLVNEKIINEHYYEEEDFVTNTYSRNLLDKFEVESVRQVIQDASSALHSLADPVSEALVEALDSRLSQRHSLLAAIDSVQYRDDPDLIKSLWSEAAARVDPIKASSSLGKPVPAAFSVKIQRRLASTMPPRPIVQLSFDDAIGHFTRLLQNGIDVIDVLDFHDTKCLQTFVMSFQAIKPQPLIFIRTILQSFIFRDMLMLGHMSIRQILDDDLALTVLPSSILLDRANDDVELPQDPRCSIAVSMESFRKRAAQPYLDILRTFCQNRCRVRRTFCHVIRDWDSLQSEAEDFDLILQQQTGEQPFSIDLLDGTQEMVYCLPLSSWAFLYKVKQMEWIVQLGFELDVYQMDEITGMYWYLSYLARERVHHVNRLRCCNVHRLRTEEGAQDPPKLQTFKQSTLFIHYEVSDASVTVSMAEALFYLYTALYRLSLLQLPQRPYSTDELRYELRMKPFFDIGDPAVPSYKDFLNRTRLDSVPTDKLLEDAAASMATAKKTLETTSKLGDKEAFSIGSYDRWSGGVKGALKSAIATSLAISMVQKAMSKSGEGETPKVKAQVPPVEKAYHEWWIVPKITPI